MTERAGRGAAAVLAAAALGYAAFFYRDLLASRVYVFRDIYTILLATEHVVRLLSEWEWPPLWNPFQVLGKPLVAEPLGGIYYPFNWIAGPARAARLQRIDRMASLGTAAELPAVRRRAGAPPPRSELL